MLGVIMFRQRSKAFAQLGASLAAAGALVYFALSYTGGEGDGSVSYRARLWQRGLEEFSERPLFGASYAKMVREMRDLMQGEGIVDFVNSYIYFALLTGAVGAIIFAVAMILPAARLWLHRRALSQTPASIDAAAFCAAFIASAAVMYAFTSFGGRTALLLQIVIGLAGTLSSRRTRRAHQAPLHQAANSTYRSPAMHGGG
jgi:O-antigen ligase